MNITIMDNHPEEEAGDKTSVQLVYLHTPDQIAGRHTQEIPGARDELHRERSRYAYNETNDDYDGYDHTDAESFPASDPPGNY